MRGIDHGILLAALDPDAPGRAAALAALSGPDVPAATDEEILAFLESAPERPRAAAFWRELRDGGRVRVLPASPTAFEAVLDRAAQGRAEDVRAARTALALIEAGIGTLLTACPERYPELPGLTLERLQPGSDPVSRYGRQWLDEADLAAVTRALRSDWLTTGPTVERFERAVARVAGAAHGVAVSSGTAALHCAMAALDIGPGDEVLVPPLTFSATANCVVYQGGTPVFADVEPGTLLLDPEAVRRAVTPRTRAIIAVDYAGQPCDYGSLRAIAREHGLALVADACHSLGASENGHPAGSLVDITCFSFHPVKHITTGEGGMLVTDDPALAEAARRFRNHGITADFRQRERSASFAYDIPRLGRNYRLPEFNCALGLSQLNKLPLFLARRRELAETYRQALAGVATLAPLALRPEVEHAYHLFVVRARTGSIRDSLFAALRGRGVGVNVHYTPVHLLDFYRRTLGAGPGLCPEAEAAFETILTLPLHPGMRPGDARRVAGLIMECLENGQKNTEPNA